MGCPGILSGEPQSPHRWGHSLDASMLRAPVPPASLVPAAPAVGAGVGGLSSHTQVSWLALLSHPRFLVPSKSPVSAPWELPFLGSLIGG